MRKALSRKPIEGRILGVERVPFSRSLQVFNIGDISEDSLSAYFENTRRSGGSGVAEVRIKRQDKCAIVSFENHESKHNTCLVFKIIIKFISSDGITHFLYAFTENCKCVRLVY